MFCICFSPLFLRLTAPSDTGHIDPKATAGGSRTTGLITCRLATCLHTSLALAFLVSQVSSSVPLYFTRPFHLRTLSSALGYSGSYSSTAFSFCCWLCPGTSLPPAGCPRPSYSFAPFSGGVGSVLCPTRLTWCPLCRRPGCPGSHLHRT